MVPRTKVAEKEAQENACCKEIAKVCLLVFRGHEHPKQHPCITGGVRTGGYPKAAPVPGPLGFDRTSEWDLLWSPARLALKVSEPSQAQETE
eukprot:1137241-Pelagomonas_calceolata.AAC.1